MNDGGDAGPAAPPCQLQAATDLIPATAEIEIYRGLASNGTSLFAIHPEDRRLLRVPVNGGALDNVGDHSLGITTAFGTTVVGTDGAGIVKIATTDATETTLAANHVPTSIASDGTTVYWTEVVTAGSTDFWSVGVDGANAHRLTTRPALDTSLAIVNGSLSWLESQPGATVFVAITAAADALSAHVSSVIPIRRRSGASPSTRPASTGPRTSTASRSRTSATASRSATA